MSNAKHMKGLNPFSTRTPFQGLILFALPPFRPRLYSLPLMASQLSGILVLSEVEVSAALRYASLPSRFMATQHSGISAALRYASMLSAFHQRIKAAPHVNPLPKAARQTKSPLFTLPASTASAKAIGIEAAVVFPYF